VLSRYLFYFIKEALMARECLNYINKTVRQLSLHQMIAQLQGLLLHSIYHTLSKQQDHQATSDILFQIRLL
jgi:hypothetical protein